MSILGKAQGVFDLENSDLSVGSYLLKKDIKTFLCVDDSDLNCLKFRNFDGIEAIDERKVQKAWYRGEISNAPNPEERLFCQLRCIVDILYNALEARLSLGYFPINFSKSFKANSGWLFFNFSFESSNSSIDDFEHPIKKSNPRIVINFIFILSLMLKAAKVNACFILQKVFG